MKSLELRVPPLIVVPVTALAMWVVAQIVPSLAWPSNVRLAGAIALGATGLAVAVAGVREFRRAKTTVNPMKPAEASSVVRSGIYRYTRNPMYLGLLLLLAGWAVWLANVGAFVLLPVFVAYMSRFQIRPEERALAANFGPDFDAYRREVRRWL